MYIGKFEQKHDILALSKNDMNSSSNPNSSFMVNYATNQQN